MNYKLQQFAPGVECGVFRIALLLNDVVCYFTLFVVLNSVMAVVIRFVNTGCTAADELMQKAFKVPFFLIY